MPQRCGVMANRHELVMLPDLNQLAICQLLNHSNVSNVYEKHSSIIKRRHLVLNSASMK